jgi:hypothetical protein
VQAVEQLRDLLAHQRQFLGEHRHDQQQDAEHRQHEQQLHDDHGHETRHAAVAQRVQPVHQRRERISEHPGDQEGREHRAERPQQQYRQQGDRRPGRGPFLGGGELHAWGVKPPPAGGGK